MLNRDFKQFAGQRIVLLQGPVGPFFARFARDLAAAGADVHKINFHAGDWLFYRSGAVQYRGTREAWPDWFEAYLRREAIDTVFLFGDCRPIHSAAHAVASRLGVEIGVFEEGYVRPNYVTLERSGVNGHSRLPRNPGFYRRPAPAVPEDLQVGNTFWQMVWWGFCYFTVGALGRPFYPDYQHHRPLNITEAWPWIRSLWRKQWYRWRERHLASLLAGEWRRRYYLVPLQVHNDAQLAVHADFDGIEHFIEETIASFAAHAPEETLLAFKHHPLDRGYRDYARLIRRAARAAGVADRVLYLHDQHLPLLLRQARGVVVVNSTVGLSAMYHHAPTKACGEAIYDIEGLTFQGPLDAFWEAAGVATRPDPALLKNFRAHLIARTQLNGSFYKRLPGVAATSGLVWGGSAVASEVDWRLADRRRPDETGLAWPRERRARGV